VFLPLAIGWLFYRRTKPVYIVGTSFLVGLIVQAGVTLTSPPQTGAPIDVPVLAEATSGRVFGAFLFGVRGESAWWSANWQSLVFLGPIIVIVLLLVLGIGADRRARITAGSLVVFALVLFAIPAWGRGTVFLGIGPSWIVSGHHDLWGESRFSVVPVMLLVSAISILLAPTGSSTERRQRVLQRIAIPVFALWLLIVIAVSFPQTTVRGEDPSWISRVDRVVSSECSNRPGAKTVTVPNLVFRAPPLSPKAPVGGYYPLVVRCANLE
jgi:hypothetical protein